MRKRPGGTDGFTLVEVLIVVTLLGILATAALAPHRSDSVEVLRGGARTLAADLRQTRALAIRYGSEYTVAFDFAENRYTIAHTGSGSAPPPSNPMRPPSSSGEYVVDFDEEFAAFAGAGGVHLADASLATTGTGVRDVVFGSQGGTGPARNEDTRIRLSVRDGEGTTVLPVDVSWLTGSASVGSPSRNGAGAESTEEDSP